MNQDEFEGLHREHLGDLWKFCRRRCSGPEDADDLVGEVFAVAWRRRDDLPGPDEVRLWLFGTAKHAVQNQSRSARRREALTNRLRDGHRTSPTDAADPATSVEGEGLLGALATLRAEDREILILRCWDQLPVKDIATLLACSPNAASIRIHKARNRLAGVLGRAPSGTRSSQPSAQTDDEVRQ